MDTMVIQFNYMMLFLRTPDGMDVLLPRYGHVGCIRQPATGKSAKITPTTVVRILEDGVPMKGTVRVNRHDVGEDGEPEKIVNVRRLLRAYRADGDYFVDKQFLRKYAGQYDTSSRLNARIELNGGQLIAGSCLCQQNQIVARWRWRFRLSMAPHFWGKRLTDRAVYTLLTVPGRTYEVLITPPKAAGDPYKWDASQGSYFEIENADTKTNALDNERIEEMTALYDLYNPSLREAGVQVPERDTSLVPPTASGVRGFVGDRSPEVPMCPPLEDCEEGDLCQYDDDDCDCAPRP